MPDCGRKSKGAVGEDRSAGLSLPSPSRWSARYSSSSRMVASGLPAEWVRRLRQRTGHEVYEAPYAKQAAEKVPARIEKQLARMQRDDGKSQQAMKIVRRSFCKRNGQPVEEIKYVVEKHRPGDASGEATGVWKDMLPQG